MTAAFFGGWEILLMSLAVLLLIFWIWMLVDCVQNPRLNSTQKIVWTLIIVFTHWVGALVYYFAREWYRKENLTKGQL